MALSLFVGLMGGAILGFATQNGRSRVCEFIRERHPTLFKSIGLFLLTGAIILPALELTGTLAIDLTPFFWGGCMACNFIFGFFLAHCDVMQKWQEE